MAANPAIQITIQARDRFGPAFDRLDDALQSAGRRGRAAGEALTGVGGAMAGVAERAAGAEAATADLGQRLQAGAQAAEGARRALRREGRLAELEAERAHGERLVARDAETARRRNEVHRSGDQQRLRQAGEHHARLEALAASSGQRLVSLDAAVLQARLKMHEAFFEKLAALAETQGRAMAGVAKTLAIARALMDTYRAANAALASVPYPLNFAAAALVTAAGLANVQRIRQVGIAHGGLREVPADATFLLQRGERVLSTGENRDLTAFLERQGGRPAAAEVRVGTVEVHVLENAAAGQALLSMERDQWRQVVAERIIPALDELAALGIGPHGEAGEP